MSVDAAAAALVAAWHGGPPLAALPEDSVPRDLGDAYEVQERVAAGIGGAVVGWKLAVVTPQAQAAAGLSAPTVGPILASMLGASGHRFAPGALRQPEIEPEIALVLARDIAGPADADQVRAATAEVRLAMEVADTRYVRKPVYGQPGIIADMNACAALLLGPVVDPEAAAVAPIRVRLGDGAIVTGFAPGARPDPFAAVAFLSGFLAARGRSLHAGDVITTGTCAPPTRTAPGRVTCEFEGLGEVETIIG